MPSEAPHPSFTRTTSTHIPEVGGVVNQYTHIKTGAQIISVVNDDTNKVFCTSFRTPVPDATGVAHIIEHAVLNGSRKYQVKEPFAELIRGSVNTFVNAFTYPDKTCYPVASENATDLYNMIDVYLDAIFFPLLTPETFMQEAWHYEYDSDNDKLSVSGVVLNEMKGAYASPERWESGELDQALMPDSSYAPDSGGDPLEIPNLSYKQFKDFHAKYYHPSNARIFFWGDDPEADRLTKLAEYLDQFDKQIVNTKIKTQKRFTKPRQKQAYYPAIDKNLDRGRVILAWLLPDLQDSVDWLAWDVLEYLLLGTSTAPLRKALIDSGFGSDLTATGWESELAQHYFSVGLKDVPHDTFDQVERLILNTLEQLAKDGFSQESITAALNSTEFNYREMNTGSYPRGLVAAIRCLATWLYDGDPLVQLQFESDFEKLRKNIKKGNYFEQMISSSFLDNQHKIRLDLLPKKDLLDLRQKQEAEALQTKLATLSSADKQQIVDQTQTLQDLQNTPDDPAAIAAIPRLHTSDLDTQIKYTPTNISKLDFSGDSYSSEAMRSRESRPRTSSKLLDTTAFRSKKTHSTILLTHPLDTNGIIYLDYFWSLDHLRAEQIPLLNLLTSCLLELGTSQTPIEQLLQRIDTYTGGLTIKLYAGQVYKSDQTRSGLIIRGKVLPSHLHHLLEIINELTAELDLTQRDRITQLINELIADLESSLTPNGHATILRRLKSQLDPQGWWHEQIGGVGQLHYLRQLKQQWGSHPDQVITQLQSLLTDIFAPAPEILNLTTDEASINVATSQLTASLPDSPQLSTHSDGQPWASSLNLPASPQNQLVISTTDMNYVGAIASLPSPYSMNGRELVAAQYLSRYYMWNEVRVKNGAYGGMAGIDPISGHISLVSYRDPNLEKTLQTFNHINQHLTEVEINGEDSERLIIGTISNMDQYQLPDARGYAAMIRHLSNISDSDRQIARDQVLAFKSDQLAEVHLTFLNLGAVTNAKTDAIADAQIINI